MSKVAAKLNISQVGRVCVTVADTDRAIDFYVGTLGFEKVVDVPMGEAMRWVEVALPGAPTTIALAPPPQGQEAGGSQTGICLDTSDVDADHAALKAAGVRRRRRGHPLGRARAADVLAARPGRKLADRRRAVRVGRVTKGGRRHRRPPFRLGRAQTRLRGSSDEDSDVVGDGGPAARRGGRSSSTCAAE